MPRIFLSYRREDTSGYALPVYDRLVKQFGHTRVFKDIDAIEPGLNFLEEIERAVSSCDVFIALIGRNWLAATDTNGQRRLDDQNDIVRIEIQTALDRNIRVIPVLVGGATMPDSEALPEDLQGLAQRQAIDISDKRFQVDMDALITSLKGKDSTKSLTGRWGLVAGILSALAVVVFFLTFEPNPKNQKTAKIAETKTLAVDAQEEALTQKLAALSGQIAQQQKELEGLKQRGEEKSAERARVQAELESAKAKASEITGLRKELAELRNYKLHSQRAAEARRGSELAATSLKKGQREVKTVAVQKKRNATPISSNQPEKIIIGKDGAPMVLIPAGSFWMGSHANVGEPDEHPSRIIGLDSYYIDTYEVTTSRYGQFIKATNQSPPSYWEQVNLSRDGNKPVIGTSWQDAKVYCQWAGKRLPTEAEWEKAARGSDMRKFPWGNDEPDGNRANFKRPPSDNFYHQLKPIGSYEQGKSPYGVYDMAGNVWEWVADWYGERYYTRDDLNNPKGPLTGDGKVIRGGSWAHLSRDMRSANRVQNSPSIRKGYIGFRCAKDAK